MMLAGLMYLQKNYAPGIAANNCPSSQSKKLESYDKRNEKDESGDGPELCKQPERQRLPGRTTKENDGSAETPATGGNIRANRSGVEDIKVTK